MSDVLKGGRQEPRDELVGEVLWYHADATEPLVHDGGLINISSSGLNIISNLAVHEGDVLVLLVKGINSSARPAVVKWCKEIAPMTYRVGLRYKDPSENQMPHQ